MLKSKEEILRLVQRHFDAVLCDTVAGESFGVLPVEAADGTAKVGERSASADVRATAVEGGWPYTVALGRPRADELAGQMVTVSSYVGELRNWSARDGFEVVWSMRMAGGRQTIPTHVVVSSIDVAAAMLGRPSRKRLLQLRERASQLNAAFPHLDVGEVAGVLRATREWDEVDFSLLLDAALWFACNDASGLTPRQVPLAGFHAKWLNGRGRQKLVAQLAGLDALGLVKPPPQVELAYLDPAYLAGSGRKYDLHVVGDACRLPYEPRVVVIVENRDTFRYFPQVEGGICINGAGSAGIAHVCQLPWIGLAAHLVYWGDMDADGLQILDGYRASGLELESMLMDHQSYLRYERYGTSQATGKQSLAQREYKQLAYLKPDEEALYQLLCDPQHTGYRRIEQERIPLADAQEALRAVLGQRV